MGSEAPELLEVTPEMAADAGKFRAARHDAASQYADAFSDEYAVEHETVRGGKVIEYENVPIRNADGSLNAAGKALLEIQKPVDRAEGAVADKLREGDYKSAEPDPPPRVEPLGKDLEMRAAKRRGLTPVTSSRDARGRQLSLWGRGLYRDKDGRLKRLVAHYGRLVEYDA